MAALFAQGEHEALTHFYHSLYPAICLFAFHFVRDRGIAEEVAADAFIKTWRHHVKLDTPAAIRAYLYAVARNESLRLLKKDHRRRSSLRQLSAQTASQEDCLKNLLSAELARLLQAALKGLAPGSGRILELHFIEGKTLKEIAGELHISTSTVKTQKQRGLKALQKKLLRPLLFFF